MPYIIILILVMDEHEHQHQLGWGFTRSSAGCFHWVSDLGLCWHHGQRQVLPLPQRTGKTIAVGLGRKRATVAKKSNTCC